MKLILILAATIFGIWLAIEQPVFFAIVGAFVMVNVLLAKLRKR